MENQQMQISYVCGWTWLGHQPTSYHTWAEQANHYTTDAINPAFRAMWWNCTIQYNKIGLHGPELSKCIHI